MTPLLLARETMRQFASRSSLRLSGQIASDPTIVDQAVKLRLDHLRLYSPEGLALTDSLPVSAYVIYKDHPDNLRLFARSDTVVFEGKLMDGFGNYAAFLRHPTLIELSKPSPPSLALAFRNQLTERITKLFRNRDASALSLGFLLGQKSALSDTMLETLRLVGLSHAVVASGYHLSVIVASAKKLFGKISRRAAFYGSTLLLLLFLLVSGLSPSLLRASLVTFLSLSAAYFGRRYHPARLLGYAAAISLIVNPDLLTDLAWQLSFASFTGIMFLAPILTSFLYLKRQRPSYFAEALIVAFAAQLACLPISVYAFGSFSILGIFMSLLVTPLIPPVMLLTLLAGCISLLGFAPLATILALPAEFLASLQLNTVRLFAAFPWITYELPAENPLIWLIYIPLIALAILLWRITKHHFKPLYAQSDALDYDRIYTC